MRWRRSSVVSESATDKVEELVASLGRVDGVAAIFLFGSHARGEAARGSDVDLLVLFRDEKALRRGRRELFERTARTDIFVQVLARTVREFWQRTDPIFREEILSGGRLVFLSPPGALVFDPRVLLAYDLRSLTQPQKMRVRNGLQRFLRAGGRRVGRGCVLLRAEDLREAEAVLREWGASYQVTPVLLPAVQFPAVRKAARSGRLRPDCARRQTLPEQGGTPPRR